MVFCNRFKIVDNKIIGIVTILILIDGFLQSGNMFKEEYRENRHNPYFNRWFSAILVFVLLMVEAMRHNPYFNRWFSAIIIRFKY